MARRDIPLSALSLKSKLVLSYLFVIVGTVLVLSFAVSQAAQSYYTNAQRTELQGQIDEEKNEIIRKLTSISNDPGMNTIRMPFSSFLAISSSDPEIRGYAQSIPSLSPSASNAIAQDNYGNPEVTKALNQALQGDYVFFQQIQLETNNGNATMYYATSTFQINGQTVAILLAQPSIFPTDFLQQINSAILFAGFLVAAAAVICAFLLVTRFMRPLGPLTAAAEQMKRGNYQQRVPLPKSLDELSTLGVTFNEMAETIEADMNELRRQDQVRRDLIANIAHDLATPLTAIQGFSEALADDVITEPAQRQETAQRIGREVQRLRRLVADIRQMSSLEAGRTKLDLAPLDLHSLVDETIFVIAPECEQQGIALRNDIAPNTPFVLADGDRVTQVLLNLLDNARRHTPSGGQLSVGSMLRDNFVYTWVSDTGVGIDAKDLPHIFERFYRADRSRTTATGGSGLGLSIVKAIITAHGGHIWAESQPGQGTRITFTLPMAPQNMPPQTQTQKPESTRPGSTAPQLKWGTRPRLRATSFKQISTLPPVPTEDWHGEN